MKQKVNNVVPKQKVLFTHNDLDGVVSAILFRKAFPNSSVCFTSYNDGIDYKEINKAILEIVPNLPQDVSILLADISPNQETAEYLNQRGNVGMLDHHKTSLPLTKYPWVQITTSKCGALLVYEMLSPRYHLEDLWPLVELTNIYDLWKSDDEKFKHATNLSRLLGLVGRQKFCERFMTNPSVELTEPELTLLEVDDYHMAKYIARSAQITEVLYDYKGNLFGRVFADRYISILGHSLLDLAPSDVEYIAMIDMREGKVSLRGRGNVDLGLLAKEVGNGGGHKSSAGFKLTQEALEKLQDYKPEEIKEEETKEEETQRNAGE